MAQNGKKLECKFCLHFSMEKVKCFMNVPLYERILCFLCPGKNQAYKRSTWLSIFLGQICSVLLCLSSIITVFLIDLHSFRLPNAQMFAFHFLLSLVFTSILACRGGEMNLFPVLHLRGWKYLIVALIGVEGNFLTVKAFQFTSLTSVQRRTHNIVEQASGSSDALQNRVTTFSNSDNTMKCNKMAAPGSADSETWWENNMRRLWQRRTLLNCFSIPTVLCLSCLILRTRYGLTHVMAILLCLFGVSCLVWADVESEGRHTGSGRDRFIGDMMSLGGTFLFGISVVAQEFVVKTFDWVEFLGMIGLFGSFLCGVQTILFESSVLMELSWNWRTIGLIGAFALCHFAFCCVAAIAIKLSSATSLCLSLLAADFYTLLVGIQLFQYKFHALYFLSFVLVMSGVILFSGKPVSSGNHPYRSLIREQATITADLELIASDLAADLPCNCSESLLR